VILIKVILIVPLTGIRGWGMLYTASLCYQQQYYTLTCYHICIY